MNKQTRTKQSRGEKIQTSAKCKNNHSSQMSNYSWCDLYNKVNLVKVCDMCPSHKCKCQKQTAFTLNQFQLEGGHFEQILRKVFKGGDKAWNSFFKPAVNILAPAVSMAIGAKNKNPQFGQVTTKILKTITRGKFLSLTDMYRHGLRLKIV